ncbi:MAG TPA: lipoyl(octanoyl) transferase LipB [Candidatus Binataceae bacterium]|nr:lipoyl(octanoyl) transferase LipB [Candidatus Binataceae bacterium]
MAAGKILSVARLGMVEYRAALALQDAIVEARQQERIGDLLLLLEHPDVYTLGRGANERFIVTPRTDIPIYRVSRGGQVTYHGPGQLVGYPILKLEGPARDVNKYLRALEQVLIDALAGCEIDAGRREGLTGVWIGERKIASIGVGIRRWTTLHGFAINVTTDLSRFDAIVPCGIDGCVMTSVAAEGRPEISLGAFADLVQQQFAGVFGYDRIRTIDSAELGGVIEQRDMSSELRH